MSAIQSICIGADMSHIKVYGQSEELFQFVTENKVAINNMQMLLKQARSVNDVFVMYLESDGFPQLVAVDDHGEKLAHITLSEEVVCGQCSAMIFIDSNKFLNAGVATH